MRHRAMCLTVTLIAVLAASCGSSPADQTAADRTVGEDSPDWDVDQAILRTVLLEAALEAGQDREEAGCVIDSTLGAGDFDLADLEGVDLTARTSSTANADLAAALADSLIECGPSLRAYLNTDIPGSSSIPGTHEVESDCVANAYIDTWRTAYTDRFGGALTVTEPTEAPFPEVVDAVVDIIAGCEAGGAVILGASNEGHLDTHALNTLEWTCLESRVGADAFMAAFPFPEEPGDALSRMGDGVLSDVEHCRSFVAGDDVVDDPDEPIG